MKVSLIINHLFTSRNHQHINDSFIYLFKKETCLLLVERLADKSLSTSCYYRNGNACEDVHVDFAPRAAFIETQ